MNFATATRRLLAIVFGAGLLAACASEPTEVATDRPFDPNDPWAVHIAEASDRFDIPEAWIREVMWVESRGETHLNGGPTTSSAGAMGLMQIMPGTWDYLAGRYGLGGNPHDPRDNIMAGAAYIREMYDEFGAPGFLAAYNAGPGRYQQYLDGERGLPQETQNYMAMISPRIAGHSPTGSGPRPVPASSGIVASASDGSWPPANLTGGSGSGQTTSGSGSPSAAPSSGILLSTDRPEWVQDRGSVPQVTTAVLTSGPSGPAGGEDVSPTDFGLTPVAYNGRTLVTPGAATPPVPAAPPAERGQSDIVTANAGSGGPRGFSSDPRALMRPVYDWDSPGAGPAWVPPPPLRRPWTATAQRPVDPDAEQAMAPDSVPLPLARGEAG